MVERMKPELIEGPPVVFELPHPDGWTYLGRSQEDREMGVIDGKMIIGHFTFNNYYKTEDGRLILMSVQVFT